MNHVLIFLLEFSMLLLNICVEYTFLILRMSPLYFEGLKNNQWLMFQEKKNNKIMNNFCVLFKNCIVKHNDTISKNQLYNIISVYAIKSSKLLWKMLQNLKISKGINLYPLYVSVGVPLYLICFFYLLEYFTTL